MLSLALEIRSVAKDTPVENTHSDRGNKNIEQMRDQPNFGHKGTSIENVRDETIRKQKGFKGSKGTKTEWLTKNKPVRAETDKPYRG
jgi:hypothetical protein